VVQDYVVILNKSDVVSIGNSINYVWNQISKLYGHEFSIFADTIQIEVIQRK
jgi:hypothetical protein